MAKTFDIVRTQRTLPGVGPNVPGRVNFDTGAADIAQGIGAFGRGMANLGETMIKIQADKEFSEATLAAGRELNSLSAFIRDNHDLEAIDDRKAETFDRLANMEIKNGLGQRKYQQWLNQSMPTIEQNIEAQKRRVVVDDWMGSLTKTEAKAIDAGSMVAVESMVAMGQAENILTSKEARQHLTSTEYGIYLKLAQDNPDAALALVEGGKVEGSQYLGPDHARAIRAGANAQLAENQRTRDKLSSALIEDVNRLAAEGKSQAEVRELIMETVGVSNAHKTEYMKIYLNGMQIWHDTNINPYEDTRLPQLVNELDIKINAGVPLTKADIVKVQSSNPEGGPTFSHTHLKYLFGKIDARDDDIMRSEVVKGWETRILRMNGINPDAPEKATTEDSVLALEQKLHLHKIIRGSGGNLAASMPAVKTFFEENEKSWWSKWVGLSFSWSDIGSLKLGSENNMAFFLPERWNLMKKDQRLQVLRDRRALANLTDAELEAMAGSE